VLHTCYRFKGNVAIVLSVMGVCRGKVLMFYTVMCQKSKVGTVQCDAKKTEHQLKSSPRTSKEVMVIQITGLLESIPGT